MSKVFYLLLLTAVLTFAGAIGCQSTGGGGGGSRSGSDGHFGHSH